MTQFQRASAKASHNEIAGHLCWYHIAFHFNYQLALGFSSVFAADTNWPTSFPNQMRAVQNLIEFSICRRTFASVLIKSSPNKIWANSCDSRRAGNLCAHADANIRMREGALFECSRRRLLRMYKYWFEPLTRCEYNTRAHSSTPTDLNEH